MFGFLVKNVTSGKVHSVENPSGAGSAPLSVLPRDAPGTAASSHAVVPTSGRWLGTRLNAGVCGPSEAGRAPRTPAGRHRPSRPPRLRLEDFLSPRGLHSHDPAPLGRSGTGGGRGAWERGPHGRPEHCAGGRGGTRPPLPPARPDTPRASALHRQHPQPTDEHHTSRAPNKCHPPGSCGRATNHARDPRRPACRVRSGRAQPPERACLGVPNPSPLRAVPPAPPRRPSFLCQSSALTAQPGSLPPSGVPSSIRGLSVGPRLFPSALASVRQHSVLQPS